MKYNPEDIEYPYEELYKGSERCEVCRISSDKLPLYRKDCASAMLCTACAATEAEQLLRAELVRFEGEIRSLFECVLDRCDFEEMIKEVYI